MARSYAWLIAAVILLIPSFSHAQDPGPKNGRISGLMYGDYFYNIKSADTLKDVNGFQFRRIYFTYDQQIAESFDVRFRLEANDVTLTTKNLFGVFVKDAYIRWNDIFEGSNALFGISPTPAIELTEKFWAYRSLEKTILDLNRLSGSRDFGIDLRGRFDGQGKYNYWVKIGNSAGSETEFDKYKRFYAGFTVTPLTNVEVLLVGQYTAKPKKEDAVDNQAKNNDAALLDGAVHYQLGKTFSLGLEGVYQTTANNYRKVSGEPYVDQITMGVSAYTWVVFVTNLRFVGRYDYLDTNTDASNAKSDLIIAGIDYTGVKNLHVMPNFYYRSFRDATPDMTTARITLHYDF
jgi:hypothetical protein